MKIDVVVWMKKSSVYTTQFYTTTSEPYFAHNSKVKNTEDLIVTLPTSFTFRGNGVHLIHTKEKQFTLKAFEFKGR